METTTTKKIKALTHGYNPKLPTKKRTIRWADEVWTPTGIVDSIRFEDYKERDESFCRRIIQDQGCKISGANYPNKHCKGCVCKASKYSVGMMCTCYEVKITLSDFKNKNGHNFHGNENYYCVPKELVPKIINLVPEHVGILSYIETPKYSGLRIAKIAVWQDVDDRIMSLLLYNAMKKWCDKATFND